jgi:hypothetical protein
VAPAAQAAQVTLHGWAYGQGLEVRATGYTGAAGGFEVTLAGAGAAFDAASFLSYCLEIEQAAPAFGAVAPASYRVVDGQAYFASRHGDASIADRIGLLLAHVAASPARVDSAAESAAMQVALWNLIYDTDLNASARSAFREVSGFGTQANSLLALLDTPAAGGPLRVWALESDDAQDLLLLQQSSGGNRVPLPATVALALLGLAAMGFTRRAGRA